MEPKPFFSEPRIKFAMVNSGGWGRRERRGEMNCGNLGEGCGRRDFPGDNYNIHCVTLIKFLKRSVQQSDQIMTEKKINIYCSWSNKFKYLMYSCNC